MSNQRDFSDTGERSLEEIHRYLEMKSEHQSWRDRIFSFQGTVLVMLILLSTMTVLTLTLAYQSNQAAHEREARRQALLSEYVNDIQTRIDTIAEQVQDLHDFVQEVRDARDREGDR